MWYSKANMYMYLFIMYMYMYTHLIYCTYNQLCASCLSWWNLVYAVRWIIASSQFTWVADVSSFTPSPAQSRQEWIMMIMVTQETILCCGIAETGSRSWWQEESSFRWSNLLSEHSMYDLGWMYLWVLVGQLVSGGLKSHQHLLVCSLIFNIVSALDIWDALHWLA